MAEAGFDKLHGEIQRFSYLNGKDLLISQSDVSFVTNFQVRNGRASEDIDGEHRFFTCDPVLSKRLSTYLTCSLTTSIGSNDTNPQRGAGKSATTSPPTA